MEFNLTRESFSRDRSVKCILSYDDVRSDNACILYFDSEYGKSTFIAADLFSALEKVRSYWEDKGFLILCAGSKPNTYPSRMSRQMSNGRKAYVHTFGIKPDKDDIIDIFEPIKFEEASTLRDQEKFMAEWYSSF